MLAIDSPPIPDSAILLDLNDLARLLRVCIKTARAYTMSPGFPRRVALPGGRLLRWHRTEVLAWLDRQGKAAAHAS